MTHPKHHILRLFGMAMSIFSKGKVQITCLQSRLSASSVSAARNDVWDTTNLPDLSLMAMRMYSITSQRLYEHFIHPSLVQQMVFAEIVAVQRIHAIALHDQQCYQ